MTNHMHSLFLAHPNGVDNFGAWIKHHHGMHAKHPLGCAEFGAEWLRRWGEVGRLLEAPARLQVLIDGQWRNDGLPQSLFLELLDWVERGRTRYQRRIVLLDGTIVREWPAR